MGEKQGIFQRPEQAKTHINGANIWHCTKKTRVPGVHGVSLEGSTVQQEMHPDADAIAQGDGP